MITLSRTSFLVNFALGNSTSARKKSNSDPKISFKSNGNDSYEVSRKRYISPQETEVREILNNLGGKKAEEVNNSLIRATELIGYISDKDKYGTYYEIFNNMNKEDTVSYNKALGKWSQKAYELNEVCWEEKEKLEKIFNDVFNNIDYKDPGSAAIALKSLRIEYVPPEKRTQELFDSVFNKEVFNAAFKQPGRENPEGANRFLEDIAENIHLFSNYIQEKEIPDSDATVRHAYNTIYDNIDFSHNSANGVLNMLAYVASILPEDGNDPTKDVAKEKYKTILEKADTKQISAYGIIDAVSTLIKDAYKLEPDDNKALNEIKQHTLDFYCRRGDKDVEARLEEVQKDINDLKIILDKPLEKHKD